MASEESSITVSLPEDVHEWLDQQASDQDMSLEEMLASLLAAYRELVEDGADGIDTEGLGQSAEIREVPEVIEERFEEQDDRFLELLEDVRDRVIQVKRETDAKAAADHEHEAVLEELDAVQNQVSSLEDSVASFEAQLEAVETDLETGFDNFEEILETLTDDLEAVSSRLDLVGQALLDTREELRKQAKDVRRRNEVDTLKTAASHLGIRSAVCGECGESVEIGLLTEPGCPHCASTFSEIEPKQRFFGSPTLTTGSPPALEGEVGEEMEEYEELAPEEESTGEG